MPKPIIVAGEGVSEVGQDMSRMPKMRCPMCGDKRSYLSENAARSALGYSIQGNFMARKKFAPDYALKVYRCPFNTKRWHFGHNMATVAVIEAARQRAEANLDEKRVSPSSRAD